MSFPRALAVLFLATLLLPALQGCATGPQSKNYLYRHSSLSRGQKDHHSRTTPLNELRRRGSFGFAVHSADSSLLILDGRRAYKVLRGGTTTEPAYDAPVRYGLVTQFDTASQYEFITPRSRRDLETYITRTLAHPQAYHALKLRGHFKFVQLSDAPVETTPERRLDDATGTLIGLRFPPSGTGSSKPTYRFVFLNRGRTLGGYVRDFRIDRGQLSVDRVYQLISAIPKPLSVDRPRPN